MPFWACFKRDNAAASQWSCSALSQTIPCTLGSSEAWYGLGESAGIHWALITKQLFVSGGQEVTDRWLPAQSRIKARSSRVQGNLTAAHHKEDTTMCQDLFFLPFVSALVWSSEYNLIYALLHCCCDRPNEWKDFEVPKKGKFVIPHVRRQPTYQMTHNKQWSFGERRGTHNKEPLCLLSAIKQ